jgi:hypothetical protein
MKSLQRLCAAFVLTLALTLSAFAGDMTTGIIDTPPPPGQQLATTGDMQAGLTGDMSTGITATDPVTTVALSLLQSLLSLF